MAEEKNTTQTIVLTEHTYINSVWLRKEFNKATDEETEKLIRKHENSLVNFLYKRTCFYIISEEGRNLKFLTWLCDRLTETAGYQYEAKLVFNDENQTAMTVIDENMESKEAYIMEGFLFCDRKYCTYLCDRRKYCTYHSGRYSLVHQSCCRRT